MLCRRTLARCLPCEPCVHATPSPSAGSCSSSCGRTPSASIRCACGVRFAFNWRPSLRVFVTGHTRLTFRIRVLSRCHVNLTAAVLLARLTSHVACVFAAAARCIGAAPRAESIGAGATVARHRVEGRQGVTVQVDDEAVSEVTPRSCSSSARCWCWFNHDQSLMRTGIRTTPRGTSLSVNPLSVNAFDVRSQH